MPRKMRLVHSDTYMGGRFHVTGGPLASEQIMGWHIQDERGFTVGVCNSDDVAERWNQMERLIEILGKIDATYNLKKRFEEGYIDQVKGDEWYDDILPLLKSLIDTRREKLAGEGVKIEDS